MLTRRRAFFGLLAAPAIVRVSSIMPVSVLPVEPVEWLTDQLFPILDDAALIRELTMSLHTSLFISKLVNRDFAHCGTHTSST